MVRSKVALFIPSLSAGGAERVMSILANEFSKYDNIQVHLVLYTSSEIFYRVNNRIIIHKPLRNYPNLPKLVYMMKTFLFIRKVFRQEKPDVFLSFGGKFNSLVLMASIGFRTKSFISDRSRPGISYGLIPDIFNRFVYRISSGIIAQTKTARDYSYLKTKHKNIRVIPNPVLPIPESKLPRENTILNVGRFISSKKQEELIDIFIKLNLPEWKLVFIGEGPRLEACKIRVEKEGFSDRIQFIGNTVEVNSYFQRSKIFAFTSISEGYPNSLIEAMSAGCACISFDCVAGPSDVIVNGINGVLIPIGDNNQFAEKLFELANSNSQISKFSREGEKISMELNPTKISKEYLDFMIKDFNY
ncbi:MAG: glycosyltransferase [Bacteroidia bacterium]|nr:glycosyltransferase [Bacteroidia bacterium]